VGELKLLRIGAVLVGHHNVDLLIKFDLFRTGRLAFANCRIHFELPNGDVQAKAILARVVLPTCHPISVS
jgi:hypothetical protein